MRLPEVAAMWQAAGVSVVPIVAKNRPAIRWKEYQLRVPNLDELHDWWGNGHPYGIAVICGNVSGNLEMTELEARALDSHTLTDIANGADSLGCGDAWDLLISGYTQQSPTGGLHLVYRISDAPVPGNEKIAFDRTGPEPLVLAETRGDGGYFVSAPSPGSCHPSGEPWLLTSGLPGQVPTITWEQRCLIHQAIREALDTSPPLHASATDLPLPATVPPAVPASLLSPPQAPATVPAGTASTSPGDHWASQTDWADILEPNGWTLMERRHGGERLWVRPGKDRRDGHSASTDYNGKPGFYVWSTSAGFETEVPLSKLFVYAHFAFGGDMKACAQALKRQGWGSGPRPEIRNLDSEDLTLPESANLPAVVQPKKKKLTFCDVDNARLLWERAKDRFRYVREVGAYFVFDGTQWTEDYTGAIYREWYALTDELLAAADERGDEKSVKYWISCRMQGKIQAAINMLKTLPEAAMSLTEMDQVNNRINLINGEYNVNTKQLEPHQAEHFMTRTMKASYRPDAQAPRWTEFLEQILPDESVRKYVQRAVGYTLFGHSDQRAFFIIHGPSGTGKSQFLSALGHVFSQYATTAAEGTFRSHESSLTNDLHGLRGKRLVTTSETADGSHFNENLMKQLTGRDQVVSRELYQKNVEWTPECAIWIATNHLPKFNSDDNAIWRRAKLIPFLTEFGINAPDVPDYARKYLYAESDGILNWILEGLHDFLEHGLGEPEEVIKAQVAHREQSDAVIRFLEDQFQEEVLVPSEEGSIRTVELYHLYEEWCRNQGEQKLGSRRFMNRMTASGRASYARTATARVWKGLYRPGSVRMELLDS